MIKLALINPIFYFSFNRIPNPTNIEKYDINYDLIIASLHNSNGYEMINLLFQKGFKVESSIEYQTKLIESAITSNNIKNVEILLSHGVKYEFSDDFTLPMIAAINIKPDLIFPLLDFETKPINFCSPKRKKTLLGLCCFYGNIFKPVILEILKRVTDIELPFPNVSGPVHWMCTLLDVDIAKEFLKFNIDVNKLNQDGLTGFHLLINKSKKKKEVLEIMKLLINAGFDVNIKRPNSVGILEAFSSAISKSYPAIKLLIENGADIYATDKQGIPLFDKIMMKYDIKLKKLFMESPLYIKK